MTKPDDFKALDDSIIIIAYRSCPLLGSKDENSAPLL